MFEKNGNVAKAFTMVHVTLQSSFNLICMISKNKFVSHKFTLLTAVFSCKPIV